MRTRLFLFILFLLQATIAGAAPTRILHVMSYHAGWEWNKDQFDAFKKELHGLDVEYKVVELDGKRVSKEVLQQRAHDAHQLITSWKPDLVYVNDDIAQEYITRKFINHATPFVYSAVNKTPEDYGFDKAANITGVLEVEHFVPTLNLLKSIKPGIRKIAVITDTDPTWQGVLQRIRRELAHTHDVEVTEWIQPKTFDEYKSKVTKLQNEVDALAILGIFNFNAGKVYVDYEEVLRWTANNSRIPDFSFWDTRIERGTLCAVTVSGIEQGREAGRIAKQILVDKIPPNQIKSKATIKGRPMVSLARAKALSIAIPSTVLLSAKVIPDYAWNK